jgi:hypothetical protein
VKPKSQENGGKLDQSVGLDPSYHQGNTTGQVTARSGLSTHNESAPNMIASSAHSATHFDTTYSPGTTPKNSFIVSMSDPNNVLHGKQRLATAPAKFASSRHNEDNFIDSSQNGNLTLLGRRPDRENRGISAPPGLAPIHENIHDSISSKFATESTPLDDVHKSRSTNAPACLSSNGNAVAGTGNTSKGQNQYGYQRGATAPPRIATLPEAEGTLGKNRSTSRVSYPSVSGNDRMRMRGATAPAARTTTLHGEVGDGLAGGDVSGDVVGVGGGGGGGGSYRLTVRGARGACATAPTKLTTLHEEEGDNLAEDPDAPLTCRDVNIVNKEGVILPEDWPGTWPLHSTVS